MKALGFQAFNQFESTSLFKVLVSDVVNLHPYTQVNKYTAKIIQYGRSFQMTAPSLAAVCGLVRERGPPLIENDSVPKNFDLHINTLRFFYGRMKKSVVRRRCRLNTSA